MLLTQFCKIREATAMSGIQFELLTEKTSDKMVWGGKTQNQTNTNKNPHQNYTRCSENPRLHAFKDRTWSKVLTSYSASWHWCRGL